MDITYAYWSHGFKLLYVFKIVKSCTFSYDKTWNKIKQQQNEKKLSDAQGLVSCFLREKYIKL